MIKRLEIKVESRNKIEVEIKMKMCWQ